MKLRSFRLRIALLSAMLAGSALVGFATVSWLLIYQTKIARLDSEIKSQLLQKAWYPPWETEWPVYEQALSSVFGPLPKTSLAVLVLDHGATILYQSNHWPADLKWTALWPADPITAHPFPPPPRGFPPPPLGEEPDPAHRPPPPPRPPNDLPAEVRDALAERVKVNLTTRHSQAGAWRLGVLMPPHPHIAIAISFEGIDWEMSAIRNGFLITIPLALVGVTLGAWVLSGRALRPIHEVSATLRQVSAKGLDQRIAIAAADIEFLELLEVFNQMMERLERSFKQASRFSADAAHELKTPLAILQGELERTLQQADPGSELQQNLSHLLDEVCRLSEIVRKLLLLSLADAGQMRFHRVEVNLSEILADLVEDMEMLAPHLPIQTQIEPALKLLGDRDLLIQILHNLTGNAIKYNLPKGWLRIEARSLNRMILVTVRNCSQGIPARERERIFERFYRSSQVRGRQIEGLGLGLSLSREIARAHGGDLKLEATVAGETAFTLSLPKD